MLDLFLIAQLQTAPQPTPCGEAKPVQVEAPGATEIKVRVAPPGRTPPEPLVRILTRPMPPNEQPIPGSEYFPCDVCQFVPHWQLRHLKLGS